MEQGIKEKVTEFMDASCFLPYIQRHEIESLMYTSMDGFNVVVDDQESLDELQRIIDSYPHPRRYKRRGGYRSFQTIDEDIPV